MITQILIKQVRHIWHKKKAFGWGHTHEIFGLLCFPTTIPNNFQRDWLPPTMSVTTCQRMPTFSHSVIAFTMTWFIVFAWKELPVRWYTTACFHWVLYPPSMNTIACVPRHPSGNVPSARGSVGAPNTVPEDALNVKPGQLNLVYHQGCMPLFCIHLLNLQKSRR